MEPRRASNCSSRRNTRRLARRGAPGADPDRTQRPDHAPDSATYHLPVTFAGVQIDCPITRGHVTNSSQRNAWGFAEGCAATAMAGGFAVDRAGHVHLSAQAALVCQPHANGQRTVVRRWRRSAQREEDLLPLRTRLRRSGGNGTRRGGHFRAA